MNAEFDASAQIQPDGHIGSQAKPHGIFQFAQNQSGAVFGSITERLGNSVRTMRGNFVRPVPRDFDVMRVDVDGQK